MGMNWLRLRLKPYKGSLRTRVQLPASPQPLKGTVMGIFGNTGRQAANQIRDKREADQKAMKAAREAAKKTQQKAKEAREARNNK